MRRCAQDLSPWQRTAPPAGTCSSTPATVLWMWFTDTEVLQGILHVRCRRLGMKDAVDAVRAAATLVREVLPVTRDDVLVASDLVERHRGLGARDALHAAVMKNGSLHLIASVDAD